MTADVSVRAEPGPVFAFLADATNNPTWQRGMRECEWLTPPPIGVGSRYRQEAGFLGRPVHSVFEVVAFDDGRSITIHTIDSTFPIRVTRSVEAAPGGGTIVHADISGGPDLPRFAAAVMGRFAQRSVTADYRRLVAHFA